MIDAARKSWDCLGLGSKEHHRCMARAAIAAMREPSEEMIVAGRYAILAKMRSQSATSDAGLTVIWQAMIDAALSKATDD
jgi:hypothetical protein